VSAVDTEPAPDTAGALRIGILQADSVRPEFIDAHGDYPAMFRALLATAGAVDGGPPVAFLDWDVKHGELPASTDAADAWLITGSRDSVYDDADWIRDLEAFVARLHAERRKLVGICFGHQLVARVLGGEARAADVGWAVGVHRSRLVERPPWLRDAADGFALLSSHKDQVTRLPDGATLLATNETCPIAAFTVGDHILCIQGHPEFVPDYARALMTFRRELLGEAVYARGIDSLATPIHPGRVARWMLDFMRWRPAA
jgi:GMP synthase-like glutamine amidotransferase